MPLLKDPKFVESLPQAPGDSREQREAETMMVAEYSRLRGLILTPKRFELAKGVFVQVDGVNEDESSLCEAYAHQGPLKGGQTDKVAMDALKLLYLTRDLPGTERVLLFNDESAARVFRSDSKSWVARALAALGLKVEVVEIPAAMREALVLAQDRQKR